jgi:3-deoxy-D-manno-octulosonate 8-phosphate phosphatase KdsC-like HAD superfamily phosphatase
MRIEEISALFYDFDGVMTDNHVLVDQNGVESVYVNRGDGYAIARFREMGIPQVIVSTEKNPVVERRAEKLGIPGGDGVIRDLYRYLTVDTIILSNS